ncbi:MAG: polyphosphate polymerase domain-containing protein [Fibrobacter sp.]|nr:polyphosphate polymerase domain-containing protein [Fibrobacter sp.]
MSAKARGFSLLERFELKYHIPVEWADDIGRFIAPYCEEDHYSQITPGNFYWITNLYLDSNSWTFFNWRKRGLWDRFNMRIRTYGIQPDPEGIFHFEVKRKLGRISTKSRATLKDKNPIHIFETPEPDWEVEEKHRAFLKDFMFRVETHQARPRLLTQYKRRAWFGLNEEYSRVTIDTSMRWREENGFNYHVDPAKMNDSGYPRYFLPGTDAVLELKAPAKQVPYWMVDLIRHFDLRLRSFSKFGSAAQEFMNIYGVDGHSHRTPVYA